MRNHIRVVAVLILGLIISGCGASNGSNSNPGPNNSATIQQGQLEFDFQPPVPANNGIPALDAFMEVDLQVTETQFFAGTNALTNGPATHWRQPTSSVSMTRVIVWR